MQTKILHFKRLDRPIYYPALASAYTARVLFRDAYNEILLVSYKEEYFKIPAIAKILTHKEAFELANKLEVDHNMELREGVLYYPLRNKNAGRIGCNGVEYQKSIPNIQFRPE